MRQIAAYVDERIREIASLSPNKSFDQICVLTCLNLAAEVFSLKEKSSKAKQRLKQLLDKLTTKAR